MTFAQPFTDYEILDRVGAGAMGTVFKARHKKLGRIVALKVLKPSLARDSRYVDRLRREARIVASLNHPNIVTGYDLGEEGGYHFFVMEFVEGKSLRALLAEWGMFAEAYVLEVGTQIAQALDHAFQRSVIHRDIKPGNVLIDERGSVKLTDMGLAKGPADMTLTRDGATVGTPQYISPEQARNPQDVDIRSDLYSLGATLYHMATGVPPFTGDTMAELITKVLHNPPVPPNELNPALSDGLSLVLRKLLAKDLRVRYQTPRELLDDLDRIKRSLPPEVDAVRLSAGEGKAARRLWLRVVGAAVVVSAIGVAVWFGMQLRVPDQGPVAAAPSLEDLDATLARLPSPWARWQHLRAISAVPPANGFGDLRRREAVAFRALQAAVDAVAASFSGQGWADAAAWLRSPAVWADRARFERDKLVPALLAAAGVPPAQFPSALDTARIEALRAQVTAEIEIRDQELQLRLETWLQASLPDRVEIVLGVHDYRGAAKLWHEALSGFLDGVREPSAERLPDPLLRRLRDRCEQAEKLARVVVEARELQDADLMRQDVATFVRDSEERLAAGAELPDLVRDLRRYRADLVQLWPPSAYFRADRDPWRESERSLAELDRRLAAAATDLAARRFDAQCDAAWRTLCHGDPADALAVLAGALPLGATQEELLLLHKQALTAAAAVHDRVLQTLVKDGRTVFAFLRVGSATVVKLGAESENGRPVLLLQTAGDVTRRAALTEFLFGKLLETMQQQGLDPLAGLDPAIARRGEKVLRLVGDDLAGISLLLRDLDDPFLLAEVAPRVQRVREQQKETVYDRAGLLAKVQDARARAKKGGTRELRELEGAVQGFELAVPDRDRTDAERRELLQARRWHRLARHRDEVQAEVVQATPPGAAVQVGIDDTSSEGEITASVTLQAAQLWSSAKEGWVKRDGLLEFAGDPLWTELARSQLECQTGLSRTGLRPPKATLQVDLVVPPATVGARFYVFEFRGAAVMLVVTADDAVHAALVEGDPRKPEHAQRAFVAAMRTALEDQKVPVVPGAVHRLEIVMDAFGQTRTRAEVRVRFEGRELLRDRAEVVADAPIAFSLLPRQEMAVQQVVVRASGL